MRTLMLLAVLVTSGCGNIEQGALDETGGPCPSRDTVTGTGDVYSVTLDTPNVVGCSSLDTPPIDSIVTVDANWTGRREATSSSVDLSGTGSAACWYRWNIPIQQAGCRWTETVSLYAAKH
jgi:hypothetical protein